MDGFLGEIRLFGGDFAPRNWTFCDGRILQVDDNQQLYSLLGNTFGGRTRDEFALPKLDAPPQPETYYPVRYIICVDGRYPSH